MPSITAKIKPTKGFSGFVHIFLTALLPLIVFIMVRLDFVGLAVAVILLAKWRMFAVKPRHWPANIRANGVDIIAGLSFLIFMIHSGSQMIQLVWMVSYIIWMVVVKPLTGILGVSIQAVLAQFLGLSAIFLHWTSTSLWLLVIMGWLICYSVAKHFFTSFDEPLTRYLANMWAYFGAALIWVLGHWLLFYGVIAQPTLLLAVIGFSLAGIYYLDHTDRLSILLRRQLVFVMIAIVTIVLVFSDWGDKAI